MMQAMTVYDDFNFDMQAMTVYDDLIFDMQAMTVYDDLIFDSNGCVEDHCAFMMALSDSTNEEFASNPSYKCKVKSHVHDKPTEVEYQCSSLSIC